jgi:C-terminal processing protease CtpA/Prc
MSLKAVNVDGKCGLRVSSVRLGFSPAEAGIKEGDIVIAVNQRACPTQKRLLDSIDFKVGRHFMVIYSRKKNSMMFSLETFEFFIYFKLV